MTLDLTQLNILETITRLGTMQNKVLNGLVYGICEIYIDDVLIHGKSEAELLRDVRQVFERLRATSIAVYPKQTKLGLPEVEYVGQLVSATGTSFTPREPTTQKGDAPIHRPRELLP